MRLLAATVLSAALLCGAPAVASAQPMPACGYFTGYDDCGGGGGGGGFTEPVIRLQPAPEEPWVWPDDSSVGVPNPARKRDRPQERNQVTGQWMPKKPSGGGGGECNAETPLGCW